MSWKTNERQLEIYQLEQSPIINVFSEMENDSLLVYNIYNEGKPAFEAYAMPIFVGSVQNVLYRNEGGAVKYTFDIREHHTEVIRQVNTTGLIAKIPLKTDSWLLLEERKDSIYSMEDRDGYFLDYYDLLSVHYSDIEGNEHEKYYRITSGLSVYEISKKIHDSLFWDFYNTKDEFYLKDFQELSPNDLLDRVPINEGELYDYKDHSTH